MTLETEVEAAQRKVRTDEYGMSIGEIATMYESGELVINPSFQRLFRWEQHQKSKFIESVLLGIPIPPIFVFETKSGKWELIDGLQRVSTILEFMGLLYIGEQERQNGDKRRPLPHLSATTYLPSLQYAKWDDLKHFPKPLQFYFRRARLNVQILKRPSDEQTKYDLFQRLNSGGSIATPQEVRNCAVIMVDSVFFEQLVALASSRSFSAVSRITEAGEIKQKKLEFVMRFFTFTKFGFDPSYDVEEFIDKHIILFAHDKAEQKRLSDLFTKTFDLLYKTAGKDALRRYDWTTRSFVGQVGQVALESIAVGIAKNYQSICTQNNASAFLMRRIKSFWSQDRVKTFSAPGVSGTKRISQTIPFGEKFFAP
jgi:hypothetical protein